MCNAGKFKNALNSRYNFVFLPLKRRKKEVSHLKRVEKHPVLEFERKEKVKINFEGQDIECFKGESIVAALGAAGVYVLRENIKTARPQGLFCAIGKCSSCFMEVNGIPNVRTCIVPVEEGMVIRRQKGRGELKGEEEI